MDFRTFFVEIDYKTELGVLIYVHALMYTDKVVDLSDLTPEKLIKIELNIDQNWSEVCDLGKTSGFTTVNIIQPILGTSNRIKHSNEMNLVLEVESLQYIANLNFEEKLQSCENILDLRNVFEGRDGVHIYLDPGHMGNFGNEIVAEEIIENLIPLILIK
jgi:hypothetical protein|tara:strand:+ start:337 stop:816 length:480 start_codon:yes stop_codon:yes gene_type:complete